MDVLYFQKYNLNKGLTVCVERPAPISETQQRSHYTENRKHEHKSEPDLSLKTHLQQVSFVQEHLLELQGSRFTFIQTRVLDFDLNTRQSRTGLLLRLG